MARFRPEKDSYRLKEAMRFLRNLLANFDGDIEDNDVFRAPAMLTTHAKLRAWFNDSLPAAMREEILHAERSRDSVSFHDELHEVFRCLWCQRQVRPYLRKFLATLEPAPSRRPSVFEKNIGEFCDLMRFTPVERDILLVRYLMWASLMEWPLSMRGRSDNRDTRVEAFAMYIDRSLPEVRAALVPDAPLLRSGVFDDDLDFLNSLGNFFSGASKEALTSRFYAKDKEEPLPWDFFGRISQQHGPLLRRLLATGRGPANVLLYGAPGTGKTSFARALAAQTGRDCYFVAQDPGAETRAESSRKPTALRFAALRVADNHVDSGNALLVVDEADAMLGGCGSFRRLFGEAGGADKGLLNSVLDQMKTPVVWISNAPADSMDESSRRRFDYAIRFDALSDSQRAAVWRNQIAKAGLSRLVDDSMAAEFAGKWPTSAGGIANVLRNIKRLRPAKSEVRTLVESLMAPHCELLGIHPADDRLLPASDYSLEGLSLVSSIPLPSIVEASRSFRSDLDAAHTDPGTDQPRLNILLSGPPGTGKTEFVKYLGAQLGTRIVVKMGSDLLSKYVGGTEENIARAFHEAEADNAILFLDEVDGLLRSRAMAERSWEVTQVNELLHQMENFRGILVCATNFSDNLDPATVRRFTFKVVFDYLTEDGKAIFFERMFQKKLSPADRAALADIPALAPGDFRTVRQSMRYLGATPDVAALLQALRDESDAKRLPKANTQAKLGF